MSSLGEGYIGTGSWSIGKLRILNLFADSNLYPRLGFTVAISLRDIPHQGQNAGLTGYHLLDLTGELLLEHEGRPIADVRLSGDRRLVSSSATGHESQLTLVCDLDLLRLEQVERIRNGGTPRFRMRLSPVLFAGGQPALATVPSIDFRVPREDWLNVLAKFRGGEFELLEIRFGPGELEGFKRSVACLQEARRKLEAGDYDEAVASCRRVVEAMIRETAGGSADDTLMTAVAKRTDERRAKEYSGIVARVKQLAGFAIHEFGTPLTYSRAEAQFIVRTTASLVSLLAALLGDR